METKLHLKFNEILWVGSCLLFILGAFLPMFSFQHFFIFNDSFSLLGGILHLLGEGELLLFALVSLLSLCLPIYKLVLIRQLMNVRKSAQFSKLKKVKKLLVLSKWSMADVFVVSVFVATIKLNMVASIKIHYGLFIFAIGVLSSMWLVQRQLSAYELKPIKPYRFESGL